MASSTFKGRYEECDTCIYQYYDELKKRNNCKHSHNAIRKNANGVGVGVKYEKYFKYCGLKKIKGENL